MGFLVATFPTWKFCTSSFVIQSQIFSSTTSTLMRFSAPIPWGDWRNFHTNGCLTLISGLKLFSSRPKLKTLGDISQWDVEASEMETFLTILLRAKSMNLLRHDVNIF